MPCCVRDVAYKVLSQHFIKRVLHFKCDAIGVSQGEANEMEPILCKQVQNFAAHGMAGNLIHIKIVFNK